jgi:Leucine-rich repeat (LRR) protein
MTKCVETERQALLKFGRRNNISSWEGEDCCKWEGISCHNFTHHVTSLDLNAFGIEGKLDSSICELQHITSLNLGNNQLEGKIPSCIGSLGQLIKLDLSGNNLVGVIPPTLGNLSNLQTLDLSNVRTVEFGSNYLTSNDLEWISHLSNLRYLDLSLVNLSLAIDWLPSISKISSLSELYLANCMLITPKSIPHLNSSMPLKSLYLGENSLNSSILPWVINVSKVLTHLDLSFNSLQQSIPYDFGNMIFLQYLDLSHNEIQGNIPKSFRSMCQLKELKVNSNKLSSQLGYNIQQLCCVKNGLENLDLSDNTFKNGPLPDVSCFSALETLNLRNTSVIGTLPKSFVHLPSLQYLYLSYNRLNGVDIIDDSHLSSISTP